ncbi:MAG TPA: hypothetical protein VOB72_17225 [Candidatus Dormibacteraeota bacterium]|nr:hypothetical protein [Candidatus Dormibacteraeota bacterium]
MRLYPRRWRERYGEEFELVLRATPPGGWMVVDVLRGALDAHVRAVRLRPWLRRLVLAVCAAIVGWLNFHASDDVQPVAAALLVFGFGFGLHRPSRAWLYAVLLFAAVPVSGAWADAVNYHPGLVKPHPLYESLVALVPALIGVYTAAAVRWGGGLAGRVG